MFKRLDPDFLAEKARKQKRDDEGQFLEEIARLDLGLDRPYDGSGAFGGKGREAWQADLKAEQDKLFREGAAEMDAIRESRKPLPAVPAVPPGFKWEDVERAPSKPLGMSDEEFYRPRRPESMEPGYVDPRFVEGAAEMDAIREGRTPPSAPARLPRSAYQPEPAEMRGPLEHWDEAPMTPFRGRQPAAPDPVAEEMELLRQEMEGRLPSTAPLGDEPAPRTRTRARPATPATRRRAATPAPEPAPRARRRTAATPNPDNPADIKPFTREGQATFDAVPPGYRKATDQEFRAQTNSTLYSGMHVATDPENKNPVVLFKHDAKPGEEKRLYTASWHQGQERDKWARVERLRPHYDRLRTQLREQALAGDDTALSLWLTLETGMRPGSGSSTVYDPKTGAKKKVPTYGSSSLQNRHIVRQNGDKSVTLDFLGKKGVRNVIRVNDPELAELLMDRKRNGKAREGMAPRANTGNMGKRMTDIVGDAEFNTKDLRTLWANTVAPQIFHEIMATAGRKPRTKAEFVRWMEKASLKASKMLGNEHATFKGDYMSALPYMDALPEDWESWWDWGKKNLDQDVLS